MRLHVHNPIQQGLLVLFSAMLAACSGGGAEPTAEVVDTPIAVCEDSSSAAAVTDTALTHLLATASPTDLIEVIVSFHGTSPVSAIQMNALESIGVSGLAMRHLPIAGVVATPAQITQLQNLDGVRSVWLNHQLAYDDVEARLLTASTQAAEAPELTNTAGLPYSGAGVTILINDSGVDGTHPDLAFGSKVVANALGHTNLRSVDGMLPYTPTEGVANTDAGGSHGTHVAGIAGGDGTASDGQFLGSAPGASIAGFGSGAVIFVLDSIGGFDYALQLLEQRPEINLRIVSNSFGQPGDQGTPFNPDDPTNIATKILTDAGLFVVFSAGNSGPGPGSITGNFKKAPWLFVAANGTKEGLLAESSSRGALGENTSQTEVGCETFTVRDQPLVTTPGTDYVSARAVAADPFLPLDASGDATSESLTPDQVPFYTLKSGTSMAAPHLAGLLAVLLEADPDLTWQEAQAVLRTTATNMPGYEPYEVGAGYANIEAALAMTLGLRNDYGLTNNELASFDSVISLGEGVRTTYDYTFLPAGPEDVKTFEVSADDALVLASWTQPDGDACTCAIVLTDPAGNRYGSGIALPVLGPKVSAVAPAVPGTWELSVSGVGGLNAGPDGGIQLDPTGQTNGVAGPSFMVIDVDVFAQGERSGLGDIEGREDQGLLQMAVIERLIDGVNGQIAPDGTLTRGQLAQYLMSWGVRATRAHDGAAKFGDISNPRTSAAADAVTSTGALIMDLNTAALPVMTSTGAAFNPGAAVTREDMAFALVQAAGREAIAATYTEDLFAMNENGDAVPVADADSVSPALRGHVQDAIVLGALQVTFSADGSQAFVNPTQSVTRAEYAAFALRVFATVPFPI